MSKRNNVTNVFVALVVILSIFFTYNNAEAQNDEKVKPKYEREGPYDWKSNMVIADRKRDAEGKLLPLQSYDETVRRGMSFLLDDHLKWFIKDQQRV